MKRLLYPLILLIAITTSCKISNPPVEDTLMLSTDNLTFDNKGGELKIQVLSSATSWLVSSPDESRWLEFNQVEDTLIITASPNMGDSRLSYILINAGNTGKKVRVSQAAGMTTLMTDIDDIKFPVQGGKSIVRLSGYTGAVEVSVAPEADWLSYNYDTFRQELTVYTNGTNEDFMRTAKVVLRNASEVKEVSVTQRGIKSWFIPVSLAQGTTRAIREVIAMETERENRFLSQTKEGRYTTLTFESLSPLFSDIRYSFTKNNNYISVVVNFLYKSNEQIDTYIEALIGAGYQMVPDRTTETTKALVSADGDETVSIDIYDQFAIVTFAHEEEQPQPYPTFSTFPFKEETIGAWTASDIASYERTLGNNSPTYQQGTDYYYQRPAYKGYTFLYTLDQSGRVVKAWLTSGSKFNEAVWISGKSWKLTSEFKALITENGYVLKSSSPQRIIYTNAEKKIDLGISYQKQSWGDYLEIYIEKVE